MSQRIPCPNPVCLHEFNAAELAGVSSIVCPQCGMTIQLKAAPAAANPTVSAPPASIPLASPVTADPSVPMARPVSAVPMAVPVGQGVPMARPVAAIPQPQTYVSPVPTVAMPIQPILPQQLAPMPPQNAVQPPSFSEPTAPIVRTRARGKNRDWITYTLVLGGFLLLIAFGLTGAIIGFGGGGGKSFLGGGSSFNNSDLNFSLKKKSGWEENRAIKDKLGVSQLVLQRGEPTGFFVVDVLDYKDRMPTPAEMQADARKLLNKQFAKNLETNAVAQTQIAGQSAQRFEFHGDNDDGAWVGEVIYFAYQGIGYWLYSWSGGDGKALADEFADLRQGFAILGKRAKWDEVQTRQIIHAGVKVKGYHLVDTSGRWERDRDEDVDAHDPKADLGLFAVDPATPKQKSRGAVVVVMVLESAKDALSSAKEYILAKHKREGYTSTRIMEADGDVATTKDTVGQVKGQLAKWRINNGDGRERFAVTGVVPRSGDMLVIYAEGPWDRRAMWEDQFQKIVESIQLKD